MRVQFLSVTQFFLSINLRNTFFLTVQSSYKFSYRNKLLTQQIRHSFCANQLIYFICQDAKGTLYIIYSANLKFKFLNRLTWAIKGNQWLMVIETQLKKQSLWLLLICSEIELDYKKLIARFVSFCMFSCFATKNRASWISQKSCNFAKLTQNHKICEIWGFFFVHNFMKFWKTWIFDL